MPERALSPMVTRDGANFHAVPIKLFDIADNYGDTIWHSETLFSNGHGAYALATPTCYVQKIILTLYCGTEFKLLLNRVLT